jgi:hypothetical protein
MSRHQNAGQDHIIKAANKCFEDMIKLKYLGATIRNRSCIHEEMKSRIKWEEWLLSLNSKAFVFLSGIQGPKY